MSPFWTVFTTVLSGTILVIVGQILQNFLLAPIHEQKQAIADVSHALLLIGNLQPGMTQQEFVIAEPLDVASIRIRTLAARLVASVNAVPLYDKCAFLHMVRDREVIMNAIGKLLTWSHAIHTGGADAARAAVALSLGLDVPGTEQPSLQRIDEIKRPAIGDGTPA